MRDNWWRIERCFVSLQRTEKSPHLAVERLMLAVGGGNVLHNMRYVFGAKVLLKKLACVSAVRGVESLGGAIVIGGARPLVELNSQLCGEKSLCNVSLACVILRWFLIKVRHEGTRRRIAKQHASAARERAENRIFFVEQVRKHFFRKMTSKVSRDGWTEQQHRDFDEWSEHYATYEKWLSSKPDEHQLYDMSVRNIGRRGSLAYYRGFLDAVAHLVAVVQNSLEKESADRAAALETLADDRAAALETLAEYGRLVLGCASEQLVERPLDDTDAQGAAAAAETSDDAPLYEVAQNALPRGKEPDFYRGFVAGYEQLNRIVARVYADRATFTEPFAVLKSIFYLQSGFCIGCMIENWPTDRVPTYRRPGAGGGGVVTKRT